MVGKSRMQRFAVQVSTDCPVDWIEDGFTRYAPFEEK